MLIGSESDLLRVAVMAPLAYATLIILLRVSGKRMLSKMSAFDLVVTIALGSTLSTILLSKQVSFAEGALALGLLIGLQYVVAWISARSHKARRILKSEPALLYFDGQFLEHVLHEENVPEEAVRAGIRAQGISAMDDVRAVVLETDGSLSVIKKADVSGRVSLSDVRHFNERSRRR